MNTQVNDPKGAAGALKAPMHLIPPYALEQTAWVQKLGAEKYGPYNWRKTGVCASTYVSAIMRHLNAWRDGEDLDPESGISHIAHIASSCNILLDAGHCGTLQDDRNKKPVQNTFAAAVAKAESVKGASVAMDQRDLPIPSEWTLPPIPEGYDRWVCRGTFKGHTIDAKDRYIVFSYVGESWTKTSHFSGIHHHLEAVKDESVASDQRDLPIPPEWTLPPVPEGYNRWVYRGTFSGKEIIAKNRFIVYSFGGADWTKTSHFSAGHHHLEAVKDESVAIDQRDLPIPSGWNLPPVPKGYSRWVYRGTFKGHTIVAKDRHILYDFEWEEGDWHKTIYFSGDLHHIEAVKDESVAPDGLPPYPPVPVGYARWVYRGKGWKTDRKVCFAASASPYTEWTRYTFGCTVGYAQSHYIEAVKD